MKMPYWNTQDQQKLVWPPSFALARAYLDQLERIERPAGGSDRVGAHDAGRRRAALRNATARRALTQLASQLNAAAASSSDQAKVRMLASTVTDLANGR